MYCIVGRNNLGDVEFLPGVGGEPGMPYTVYDLPLAPTAATGQVTGLR
jgi:hypothetical protein